MGSSIKEINTGAIPLQFDFYFRAAFCLPLKTFASTVERYSNPLSRSCHLDADPFIISSVEVLHCFFIFFLPLIPLNVILLEEYLFVLNSSPSLIPEKYRDI